MVNNLIFCIKLRRNKIVFHVPYLSLFTILTLGISSLIGQKLSWQHLSAVEYKDHVTYTFSARLLLHRTDHKVVNFEENSDQLFIDEDILKSPTTTSPTVTAKSSGVVSFRSPSEPRSSTHRVSSPVEYRTQRARSSMPSPRTACEFQCSNMCSMLLCTKVIYCLFC